MKDFYTAMKDRRSIHVLSDELVVSQERLEEIISHALMYTPTSFNAQEQRLVLLMGAKHKWFWELAEEKLAAIVPPEQFADTKARIDGFAGGCGTILLYQDMAVVKGLQEAYAIYADNFPIWAQQASGMLKYTLWTALSAEGFGASLQHYTELVEEDVRAELGIDANWKMVGQLPFGKTKVAASADKGFEPIEKRLIICK